MIIRITKDMRQVRFLMILFHLLVVAETSARTSDDNVQAISVKIDSTYYDRIHKDVFNKMTDYSMGKRQAIRLRYIQPTRTVWLILYE